MNGIRVINDNNLRNFAWSVGILASIVHIVLICRNLNILRKVQSKPMLMSALFVALIAFGDLLVAVYLIIIGTVDNFYADKYCHKMFSWLISTKCP